MASEGVEDITPTYNRSNRPSALADIQYGSIVASEPGTPSEEEDIPKEDLEYTSEDVENAIGVSIGQEQSRLISPKTPAAEKAAAMEDLDGGALFDGAVIPLNEESPPKGTEDHERPALDTTVAGLSQDAGKDGTDLERMPSPWRAQPRKFTRLDATRNTLRETFAERRRTLSGSMTSETFKKFMDYLPSMPKSPNMFHFNLPDFYPSFPSSKEESRERSTVHRRATSGSNNSIPQSDGTILTRPTSSTHEISRQRPTTAMEGTQMASLNKIATSDYAVPGQASLAPPQRLDRPQLKTIPSKLRKSASHESFMLQRTMSKASSLGDDSRFESVQDQVNSRFKAIKDSFQDANFRLPSMPNRSTFSIGSSLSDWNEKRGSRTLGQIARSSTSASQSRSPRPVTKRSLMASSSLPSSSGMDPTQAITHPHFSRALEELSGDLVIMGGYRGSILRSAEPPNRQLWVPIKVGLNIRKVDLEVGLNPEDEETMEERIIPSGMLKNIGPVDISRRLFKRLKHSDNGKSGRLRVHDYGYDWRLSPDLLSRKLIKFLEGLPCNQPGVPLAERGATVIAHSLGGLITRHAVNQRPELFAGVVYAGVPTRCVNILGPLRNGDDVLFSSRVLTAQVNFTIRTSFALLPEDGECFIDKNTKERYPIDFFDPKTWVDYRLSPCVAPALPPLNSNQTTMIGGFISSMASVLPSIPNPLSRKNSNPKPSADNSTSDPRNLIQSAVHTTEAQAASGGTNQMQPHMGGGSNSSNPASSSYTASPTSTIPFPTAYAYLSRTLASVKSFKQALAFDPAHHAANIYPPISVIYGKSTPTVYGAKVDGKEGIRHADSYDELAFASGDGVVLARAAQVPKGYEVCLARDVDGSRSCRVSSERGHVTLLGDLEAVGRCLVAVVKARREGAGLGTVGS